jgi:glucokinase
MEYALGIDIGGTKTAFGIVNDLGEVVIEEVVTTKDFATAADLVNTIYDRVVAFGYASSILGIGVGAPNGNHYRGTIEFAPNLHWKGIIHLADLFEAKFNKPCILTNDANAAAYGEMIFGCAKGIKHFVSVTLGTGVGSGIIANGELLYGEHGIAGEYGHIRVVPNGRLCGCGRKGCLETYASSTGVVRSIVELKSDNKMISGLKWIENPSATDVFNLAKEGDLFAMEIVDYTAEILGSALADFAAFSDPKAYVLFGGIAQSGQAFADLVKKYMEQNILNIYKDAIEVKISSLHDKNAAVLGTASIVFGKYVYRKQIFILE